MPDVVNEIIEKKNKKTQSWFFQKINSVGKF